MYQLTTENSFWLKTQADALNISEGGLLNKLIALLREECGHIDDGLDEWMSRTQTSTDRLEEIIARLEETRASVEETLEILKVSFPTNNAQEESQPK
jgi:hypothetical protein